MEPLAALGIAGNIIQIADFASRLVSRSHELYQSADGKLADHTVLHSAAQTLLGLCDELRLLVPKRKLPRGPAAAAFISKPAGSKESPETTAADARLLQLIEDCEAAADKLRSALNKASRSSHDNAWKSVHQAVKSIYSDQEITKLASQLDNIRKQVDSTVLVSIRQRIDAIEEGSAWAKFPTNPSGFRMRKDQRDRKLLEAVYDNNWTGSNAKDVEEFSRHLCSNTSKSRKEQFCDLMLPRLYFQHMVNRSESIPRAHKRTFEWLFQPRYGFCTWLRERDNGPFWITGKPGSGKSTLMKFLYNHKTLVAGLSTWADSRGGPNTITKAGFYCWNSGSNMQMSRLGLLQTLLHNCLSGDTELCLRAFPERWKQFAAFGGGLEMPWDWFELKRAFENITSDESRSFFIMIDGLDEFDGEPKDIIKLVFDAVRPNVKICVASRPWLPFEDAFKDHPSLLLQDLTRQDISRYVVETFRENEHYIRLQLDAPAEARFLCQSIVEKALGVFLWVRLVVESLLEGLSNSDYLRDLQARLDALPSDLEALFDNLLRSVDDRYYTQACQIFYMLRLHRESNAGQKRNHNTPSLLGMHFASDDNLTSSIMAPWETLKEDEACIKSEHMRRRLVSRCRGLLETSNPESNRHAFDHEIVYLHRTARDYIESRLYWPNVVRTASHGDFRAEQRWANANLWLYKVHPLLSNTGGSWRYSLQQSKLDCASAIMSFPETECQLRKTYLDALLLADPFKEREFFEDSLKATLGFLTTVDGLDQYYQTFYLAELTARASPEEREILNKHAGHTSIDKANGRHHVVRHHGSQSFFRLTGYYKMRRGIKRLRQRTAN